MPTEARGAPSASSGPRYGLIALALLVAGLALWFSWPHMVGEAPIPVANAPAVNAPPSIATSAPASAALNPALPHRIAVTLVNGLFAGGEDTLQVRQGEQVELSLTSDKPVMLHLHGYEVMAEAGPQQPGVLAFKADNAGRFPVHEHREGPGNHRAVFFVEVHP